MRKLLAFALALSVPGSAAAQVPTQLQTRTIELKHLTPEEAVNLLKPYLVNGGATVSWVSPTMPIVTIKDVAENMSRLEQVLAKYDHSPATIRLVFQLIEADTGPRLVNTAASRVSSDLDATLRSVLRFSGYRLMAQGVATVGENSHLSQKLAQADTIGYYTYDIQANIGTIRLSDVTLQSQVSSTRSVSTGQTVIDTGATGSVQLRVSLVKRGPSGSPDRRDEQNVISTGLDVPLGHTVVLGTATSVKTGVALILTVKPELVRVK